MKRDQYNELDDSIGLISLPAMGIVLICLLLAFLVSGCSSSGGGSDWKYSGPEAYKYPVIAAVERGYKNVGIDPERAKEVTYIVNECPQAGTNQDGPYECGCVGEKCTHGAYSALPWDDTGTWWFAGPTPHHETVIHEASVHHVTLRFAGKGGHDGRYYFPHNGKTYTPAQMAGQGIRWPSWADVKRTLTFWDGTKGGEELGCTVTNLETGESDTLEIPPGSH